MSSMSMVVGFTGTRRGMSAAQMRQLRYVLGLLRDTSLVRDERPVHGQR